MKIRQRHQRRGERRALDVADDMTKDGRNERKCNFIPSRCYKGNGKENNEAPSAAFESVLNPYEKWEAICVSDRLIRGLDVDRPQSTGGKNLRMGSIRFVHGDTSKRYGQWTGIMGHYKNGMVNPFVEKANM